jgi:aflatoxin B1 aldehyde reductase
MKTILGTLNFDYNSVSEPFNQSKINNLLTKCIQLGIKDIDTAYYYGKTEEYLGKTNLLHLFNINSKANPWYNNDFTNGQFGQLSEIGIKNQINTSLNNLKIEKFNTYFLHCWDYNTPIIETLITFDKYYRQNKFDHFGVSNIDLDKLTQIINICEKEQLNIHPKIYQGMYNIYCRKIEELYPIFIQHNIEFQCYNPLAGGLLTGKYFNKNINNNLDNCRFVNNNIYKSMFWNHNVTQLTKNLNANLSLRWLKHNSKLRLCDSIIIGCSTIKHLENNFKSINHTQPLNINELSIIENFYKNTYNYQPNYHY